MSFENNYCHDCKRQLAPDDFDGVCSECDKEEPDYKSLAKNLAKALEDILKTPPLTETEKNINKYAFDKLMAYKKAVEGNNVG